mmetsp:Transcript_89433/g.213653  ORF Transcript_89433/g.213653 Transcript_89433/m.213653 type:complete len:241 (-) Transcript_89433:215-937(-)
MMTASTPAATSAFTLSWSFCLVPMAAATRSCLLLGSLVALGNSTFFLISVRATKATSKPPLVRIGSFPFLDFCSSWFAVCSSMPSSAVTKSFTGVMMALSRVCRSWMKSVSRLVTRPKSLAPICPLSVTGKPVKPSLLFRLSSSSSVIVGATHTGSRMKPALNFFTLATSLACPSTERLVWITPMPPSKAIAIAMLDSVTVSIGLDTMGVLKLILRVKRVDKHTSCTPKLMWPGKQMRSS